MPAPTDPRRLAALARYAILDTAPEPGFDDIVHLARRVCRAPVALVGLVAGDRQWFKARAGFEPRETSLDRSICRHVLTGPALLVIPDLTLDPRTRDNPLVTGASGWRFYAGARLETPAGEALGTLCVIDHRPRAGGLGAQEAEHLAALARQVMAQMELRRALQERDRVSAQREAVASILSALPQAGGDLTAILDTLVAAAMRAVPQAEGGAIEMREGAELVYRSGVGRLAPHVGLRVPLAGSLSGTALTSGEPILCPDVFADARVKRDLLPVLGMRSALYVPVRRGGEAVGILKLQSGRADAFSEDDLETAVLIAGTVASGLAEAGEAEARRAARRSEHRYRTVFESAIDHAIVVMDLDGRVTDWNAGAAHILGWTADEILGASVDAIFTPEDRAAGISRAEMRAALETGRGLDERWHLRKDGTRFFANGEMTVLREEDGTAIGFVKILRDQTESRAALVRLSESERILGLERELLGAILRQAPVGISIAYPDGRATLNLRAEAMLGQGAGQGAGPEAEGNARYAGYDAVHPDGRAYAVDEYPTLRALRTGETVRRERMLYRRGGDGAVRRWDVSSAPVAGPDGRVAAAVTVLVDVEDEHRALDALRTSEARLRTVMDTVPVGILLAEAPSGRIIMGNRRVAEILGHEPHFAADSAGYTAYVAYHDDGSLVAPQDFPLARICSGRVERSALEVRYQRPDGTLRWIAIAGEALRDAGGVTVGAVVAVSDIEARKSAEAAQDILNRELSHRLKNTLTLVQSIAAQTLRNASDLDAAREALAARLVALGRAHDILLAGHTDTASVPAVVKGALALHEDSADRFILDGPSLLIGPSAALSLALMLHELATNATKYGALSTSEGRVAVTWRIGPVAGGEDAARAVFMLSWRESGGPPVSPPSRKGFGSRLIERGLSGAVGGRIALDYHRDGVSCTLTAPLDGLQAGF